MVTRIVTKKRCKIKEVIQIKICDVLFPGGSEDLKAAIAFYWIILPKDNLKDLFWNVSV